MKNTPFLLILSFIIAISCGSESSRKAKDDLLNSDKDTASDSSDESVRDKDTGTDIDKDTYTDMDKKPDKDEDSDKDKATDTDSEPDYNSGCEDIDGDGHFTFDPETCRKGDDACDNPIGSNEYNWTKNGCENCIDIDEDGYGENCDLGPDCQDRSADYHENCPSCTDADGDGHDAYDALFCPTGDDYCDNDAMNHSKNACAKCVDSDGDGYGENCDRGTDSCDDDPYSWTAPNCGNCRDSDKDGYRVNCDDLGNGKDECDDNPAAWTTNGCVQCHDIDGDGFGIDCDSGPDSCEDDINNWTPDGCNNCVDADGDGHGESCDKGPDACDDKAGSWTQSGCMNCVDMDGDGHGESCDMGPDHCDDNVDNWTENGCSSCDDKDSDGYGNSCDKGKDCDDSTSTGSLCHKNCRSFFRDVDGDNYGVYTDTVNSRCTAPEGYTQNGGDCDDSAEWGAPCHTGCATYYEDRDEDRYGAGEGYTGCLRPGYFSSYCSNNYDCAPDDERSWDSCWRLSDNGDGTISDSETGLMWIKTADTKASWQNSINACASLAFRGYDDWRLPTETELKTIYMAQYGTGGSYTGNGCHWNELFFEGECSMVWTADEYNSLEGVYIQFNSASLIKLHTSKMSSVPTYRCVRNEL